MSGDKLNGGLFDGLTLRTPPMIDFGIRGGVELARIKAALDSATQHATLDREGVIYSWSGGFRGFPARVQAPIKREFDADDLRAVLESKRRTE